MLRYLVKNPTPDNYVLHPKNKNPRRRKFITTHNDEDYDDDDDDDEFRVRIKKGAT